MSFNMHTFGLPSTDKSVFPSSGEFSSYMVTRIQFFSFPSQSLFSYVLTLIKTNMKCNENTVRQFLILKKVLDSSTVYLFFFLQHRAEIRILSYIFVEELNIKHAKGAKLKDIFG